MVDEAPDKTGFGIDRIGWRKIGKGAVIAGAGALAGGFTGPQVISVAIEQGWISPDLPSTKPETYGLLITAASFAWSMIAQIAHKFFGRFPKDD
jgi:hypothetical protein